MPKKDSQPEKLGDVLENSLKRLDPSGRLGEYGVWPVWDDAVGPTIARHAQPEKIRNGTLFVKVASPTWMQQLQYMKEMIADKLNQSLKSEVVQNIFFFVGKVEREVESAAQRPAAQSAAADTRLDDEVLRSVKDPEIRRALRRLFTAYSRKGGKR